MTARQAQDRVTDLHVRGMRCLEDVRLPLEGLHVLIGENGAGKSTLVEACALLQRMSTQEFGQAVFQVHGGMAALLRRGARSITLTVRIEGAGPPLRYSVELAGTETTFSIESEDLARADEDETASGAIIMRRNRAEARIFRPGQNDSVLHPGGLELALHLPEARAQREVRRLVAALEAIDAQVALEVLPSWLSRERNVRSPMRESMIIQPTTRLERLAMNLPNAYWALHSDFGLDHWKETLAIVRLGLGEDVEDVVLRPDPAGGSIALGLRYRGPIGLVPAFALSDGTLSFLALVAVYRLNARRSLLVFDEPDLHLHPRLVRRVVSFFEDLAEDCPVLITTHSDTLLDALDDPARAAVLCDLNEARATRIRVVDRGALDQWLEDYRGLGDVRSAGHERSVFEE